MQSDKINLIGFNREELIEELINKNIITEKEKYRVKQLWHWIYFQGLSNFSEMTTFSSEFQNKLSKYYSIDRPLISNHQVSKDGTHKWLLKLSDNNLVEMVFIPEISRGTLCVSSQVGCTLNCKFCFTGTQRLVRNLTSEEIISQLLLARDQLGDWPTNKYRKISNIVFMGMGEPLYNYENAKTAVEIIGDKEGIQLSTKRITLSTSGIVPKILEWGKDVDTRLAISLHAPNDKIRDEIVPINKKYPLKELIQACQDYPRTRNSKRITFEYVMLKGVNDKISDARQLIKLIHGIPAKINLIPFNPWPNSPYECSDRSQIKKFSDILNNAGYSSPIRKTRGQDIMAACGQLKSDSCLLYTSPSPRDLRKSRMPSSA